MTAASIDLNHGVLRPTILTPEKWTELLEVQRRLEESSEILGVVRFNDRLVQAQEGGDGSQVGAARKLMSSLVWKLGDSIQAMLDETQAKWARGEKGRPHTAEKWIRALGTVRKPVGKPKNGEDQKYMVVPYLEYPKGEAVDSGAYVAAFIALRAVLDHIHQEEVSLYNITGKIAKNILEEIKFRRFQYLAPGLFEYRMDRLDTSSHTHRARSLSATMAKAGCEECRKKGWRSTPRKPQCPHLACDDLKLSEATRGYLGYKLLDFVSHLSIRIPGQAKAHPIIEIGKNTSYVSRGRRKGIRKRDKGVLRAHPAVLSFLSRRNSILEGLRPYASPMVVPPLAWGPGRRGGYRFSMKERYPFIRKSYSEAHTEEIDENQIPLVYEAVNRIQETPWAINTHVLAYLHACIKRGGERAGVPRAEKVELPLRPVDKPEWIGNDEARKADPDFRKWVKAVGKARDAEAVRAREFIKFDRVLRVAEEMAEYEAIWFPHSVDFRGRIYPLSDTLSPQGDDMQKALLRFAEGVPLGKEGAWFLAVHGANCIGELPFDPVNGISKVSKLTLEERVSWIEAHTKEIVEVAKDPLGVRWWSALDEAGQPVLDEPLQFLAFAIEWAGYVQAWKQGKGEQFVSHLPVAADGSCNGLQHIAAITGSEEIARQVNVLPNERPKDVYSAVSDKVVDHLEALAEEGDETAKMWLSSGLLGRSLVKRPVMTFGYGSKIYGFSQQTKEYLQTKTNWKLTQEHFTDAEGKSKVSAACLLLARSVWKGLEGAVPGAQQFMASLQGAARVIATTGQPVRWTVPETGFRVVQPYFVRKKRQIRTILNGHQIDPVYYEDTTEPEGYRQANAIAPNVIHSLDAAALQLTVVNASRGHDGMSFAMIHDSYGTHAGNAGVLAQITRESFLQLYTGENVGEFLRVQFEEQAAGEEFPWFEVGDLDLTAVLDSDFFFC